MRIKSLVMVAMILGSSMALASEGSVTCGTYLGAADTFTQLTSVSLDTLTGELTYGDITAQLKCKIPVGQEFVENASCVGVNTPHQIRLDIFSEDGVLNMGWLTVDGVRIGEKGQPEQDRDFFAVTRSRLTKLY